MVPDQSEMGCRRTRFALLWMHLVSEPLVALYTLIPFLLRRDLDATMLQVSLFISLRPVLSVFSFYWSAYLKEGQGKLIGNLVSASFLAYFPFLFFPFASHFTFLFIASAMYQLFSKAAIPALIEVLKRNIPKHPREKVYSTYFLLSFIESGVLGVVFGQILDAHTVRWEILFAGAALIGLSSLFLLSRLHVPFFKMGKGRSQDLSLIRPWQESFRLIRRNGGFADFQKAFMIGGSALMLMAPALATFYADTLSLSYANITTARFIFMAIGVAGSTFFWRKGLGAFPLLRLTACVLVGFGFFPVALLLSQYHLYFLYLAFLFYGIAQAGSHLIWNLSGTFFGGEKDSSPYTRVNILMQGIRGAIIPILGGFCCELTGPIPILILGMGMCFYGAHFLFSKQGRSLTSSGGL